MIARVSCSSQVPSLPPFLTSSLYLLIDCFYEASFSVSEIGSMETSVCKLSCVTVTAKLNPLREAQVNSIGWSTSCLSVRRKQLSFGSCFRFDYNIVMSSDSSSIFGSLQKY